MVADALARGSAASVGALTPKWKSGLPLRAKSAQRLSPQLRRGPTCERRLAARRLPQLTIHSAGAICKRRDAARLGTQEGLQPRARQTARRQLLAVVRPRHSRRATDQQISLLAVAFGLPVVRFGHIGAPSVHL